MKVRVVLMTENDKHIDQIFTNEQFQKIAENSWVLFLKFHVPYYEKAYVEKVEVIER